MSVGNLTPGSSKGCRTLHLQPKFSGTSSSNKEGSGRLFSLESVPSRGGTFVQPSKNLCTHGHGLEVAVTVGLEGDPLGRNILGLLASVPVIVVVAEVVGIVEVMAVVPSVANLAPPQEVLMLPPDFAHLLRQRSVYLMPRHLLGLLLLFSEFF